MIEYSNSLDSKKRRLANEHKLLDDLCENNEIISYEVIGNYSSNLPPTSYLITYNIKTIVNILADQSPVYKEGGHEVKINFPPGYPGSNAPPKCIANTDVWHPNIGFHSPANKGRICINAKALGAWHTLDMLVLRIGDMLQYKNYFAENKDPFPEDAKVAKWVREYAEPRGIIGKNKPIDTTPLRSKEFDISVKLKESESANPTFDWDYDIKVKNNPEDENQNSCDDEWIMDIKLRK